ncbi:MAG: hypothetical protein ACRC5M_00350 [Anaeroplasmataceae bacterium]
MRKVGVFIPGRIESERLPEKLTLSLRYNKKELFHDTLWSIACRKLSELSSHGITVATLQNDIYLETISNMFKVPSITRDYGTCITDGPLSYIFKDLDDDIFKDCTHLMFLNPCLYNLEVDTIISIIKNFEESDFEYGTSVKKLQNWLFDSDGNNINKIDYERLSTKEIEPIYQAAHCFHIFNKEQFFKDGMMLKEGFAMLIVSDEETLDVDTKDDFTYATLFLNNK